MQGVLRFATLQPWQGQVAMQGVRRTFLLQPRSIEVVMHRVRRLAILLPWQAQETAAALRSAPTAGTSFAAPSARSTGRRRQQQQQQQPRPPPRLLHLPPILLPRPTQAAAGKRMPWHGPCDFLMARTSAGYQAASRRAVGRTSPRPGVAAIHPARAFRRAWRRRRRLQATRRRPRPADAVAFPALPPSPLRVRGAPPPPTPPPTRQHAALSRCPLGVSGHSGLARPGIGPARPGIGAANVGPCDRRPPARAAIPLGGLSRPASRAATACFPVLCGLLRPPSRNPAALSSALSSALPPWHGERVAARAVRAAALCARGAAAAAAPPPPPGMAARTRRAVLVRVSPGGLVPDSPASVTPPVRLSCEEDRLASLDALRAGPGGCH
jgi:hypothetical protein